LGLSWPKLFAGAIRFAQKRPRCAELVFGNGSALGLIFCFLVIFFGSSGIELNFLNSLGE
jgi:hypothetical protein